MAGFSPRPHKVFKEVGGVLFSQMLVQSAVHLIEGDFVFSFHKNNELDVTLRKWIGFVSGLHRL